MDKTALERFDSTIWWVLNHLQGQTILQTLASSLVTTIITIDITELKDNDPNSPSVNDIRYAINAMESSWGILEILSRRRHDESGLTKPEKYWPRATCFILMIRLDKFNELYKRYEEKSRKALCVKLIIYKNGTVDLEENGTVHRAKFRKGSDTYKVLDLLARNKDVKLIFSEISNVMKDDSKKKGEQRRVRDAIKYITDKLKYKKPDFIQTSYGFTLFCDVEYKGKIPQIG